MRKIKSRVFYSILFYSILFSSCKFWNEPVRDYFDYWSSTCQVGKVEYVSSHTSLNGMENLSARDSIDVNLYTINPKGIVLLGKPNCFRFSSEDGTLELSDYSETLIDPTFIKIHAKLSDDSEGYRITISGCLWPENRTTFDETQLRGSYPELFYSTSFIQNTPPDNIKNMTVPIGESAVINGMHYVSFDVPDQRYNRNKDSTYEIKYYLNEDGSLNYKGSRILTLDDNKGTSPTKFIYYFDGQELLLYYDYTVQVIGPRGLRSEIFSTASGLGVVQVSEPTVTVEGLNGLKDEEGFECFEVENENDIVSFDAVTASVDDTLTVTLDGSEVNAAGYRVSGIGQHTIVATSSRDGCRPISVTKKIRIVKTQEEPTVKFFKHDGDNVLTASTSAPEDTVYSTYTCYDLPLTMGGTGQVNFEVFKQDDEELSVTIDGNPSTASPTTGKRFLTTLGAHTVKLTVTKQYCTEKPFTKKVYIQGILEPVTIMYSEKKSSGTEQWTNVPANTETQTLKFSYLDYGKMPLKVSPGNTGNNFHITINDGTSDIVSGSKTNGQIYQAEILEHGKTYTITINQTREHCKSSDSVSRKIKAEIKPVTVKFKDNKIIFRCDDDEGDDLQLIGKIYTGTDDTAEKIIINANKSKIGSKNSDISIFFFDSLKLTSPSSKFYIWTDRIFDDDNAGQDFLGIINKGSTPNSYRTLTELKTTKTFTRIYPNDKDSSSEEWFTLTFELVLSD